MERKIVHEKLAPVALLRRDTEGSLTPILLHEVPMDEQSEQATVRVAKLITILAETEYPVIVVTSKCGVMTIGRIQTAKPTQWILPTRSVHGVFTNNPF